MARVRDIALLLSQQRTTKQDRAPQYRGEIVEMRNNAGADSIHVDNRPLYVWIRLWAGQGSVVPVYNDKVAAVVGLPVWVERQPGSVHELRIIGIDTEILQSQSDPNLGLVVPLHSASHEWPDAGPGIDPLTVYPRAWSQLKTYPQNPLSTSVDVSPLIYQTGSILDTFNGGTVALAAAIGALAANTARLVLIYLDTSTNTLATANGAAGPIADMWALPEPAIPASNAYRSAVVRIYFGQTTIDELDIRDRRSFLNPVPGTLSNVNWGNTWVVATSGGDFTTIVAAVADARVVDGDVLFIQPNTYAGWTTDKKLSYTAISPYNHASYSADVIINTAVTLNNNPGGVSTFYGIEFQDTVILDYDQDVYFLLCGLEGSNALESGAASTGTGRAVLDHCYVGDDIIVTAGSGWDLELHDTDVDGAITLDQDLILWSHVQITGALTITGAITRVDAPHIETASYGTKTLVVGQEGAQYATVAAAIAVAGVGEAILILPDSWVCDNQTIPAARTLYGQTKDETEIYTTTVVNTIQLADNALLHDITVLNEFNTAADTACVLMAMTTATGEVQNLKVLSDNDTGLGAGIRVTATNSTAWVKECEVVSTGTGGSSYGLYATGAGTTTLVRGGYYNGTQADICVNNATATIILMGPILVNGTILLTAGSVIGYWYDVDGNLRTPQAPGSRVVETVWPDFPLTLDSLIAGDHFRYNVAAPPAGWAVVDPAPSSVTNFYYSFWFVSGTGGDPSWDYTKQTGVTIEALGANQWASFLFGPIVWRDAGTPGNIEYYFQICGETAAAIDVLEYNRVHLQWDAAGVQWRIQGESDANDGGGQTASGWTVLDAAPLHQPLFLRVVIRNDAGVKLCRTYWGTTPFPESHTLIQSVGENTVWGNVFWRINQTRAGGGATDYLMIGAVDYFFDKP